MNKATRKKSRTDRAIKNWRLQITEQQASGQEPGEFCRQRDLCSTSFYAWRKRLGMKSSTPASVPNRPALLPVVKDQYTLPQQQAPRPLFGGGFLRLDPLATMNGNVPVIGQQSRVLWIETPGGYRVAINGGVGLAEVFGMLKAL